MSKIDQAFLADQIHQMITEKKKRNFTEAVEIQIGLRDYDPEKDKRFSGSVRLPNAPYDNLKIAIIGSAAHCEQAKAIGIPCIDTEGLKKFNKDKKLIKKWAKPYELLLASESLMKLIPRLLGNILVKIGKYPLTIGENDNVAERVREQRQTVRFALKKVLCMGTRVGNADMNEEQIRQNVATSINFLVSLLKKGWHNIRTLHMKTSMSKSYRIYG
eukprot:TRINITY_DN60_c0_g1_i1.p1 TRINITY_DN60_c0_g1~~TRINITY_DN60_c0_g1_i1.p1  ORF type:complete len:216 (+),score=65.29 TRINITY_DN60_c0_g1_i1:170-817(+)